MCRLLVFMFNLLFLLILLFLIIMLVIGLVVLLRLILLLKIWSLKILLLNWLLLRFRIRLRDWHCLVFRNEWLEFLIHAEATNVLDIERDKSGGRWLRHCKALELLGHVLDWDLACHLGVLLNKLLGLRRREVKVLMLLLRILLLLEVRLLLLGLMPSLLRIMLLLSMMSVLLTLLILIFRDTNFYRLFFVIVFIIINRRKVFFVIRWSY